MSANQSLATLLRALQSRADVEDVARLLGSATTLLTLLANPLNVTLLTSQLLSAPSIWTRPDGVRTTLRVLSIFNGAARQVTQQSESSTSPSQDHPLQRVLSKEDWAVAAIKGADDSSPRWRHLCLLAGLIIGFDTRGQSSISLSLRHTLGEGIVKAANLAMREGELMSEFAANSLAMMLSQVFDILTKDEKSMLDHRLLLPMLTHASLFSKDGLHSGYFLSTMDADVVQVTRSQFDWSPKASTFVQFQRLVSSPVMNCLGPLSRLAALSLEQVQDVDAITVTIKDLASFSRSLLIQWRQNKLSEIDFAEEREYLAENSLRQTLPLLWRTLRSAVFSALVLLRSVLGRILSDRRLPADLSPFIALQTLHILRDLYFISSRGASSSFSQYEFARLTAIDILSQYPVEAEAFLKDIRSPAADAVSEHPLDRNHDLYFLNTAEQFALILPIHINESLLLHAATPYLGLGRDKRLLQVFEAAHSVMLAVLSIPQNGELLSRHVRSYVEVLFEVFPEAISARQFRIAIKTLIRITSQSSSLQAKEPLLPSIIMDLVRSRLNAAKASLVKDEAPIAPEAVRPPLLSEQAVYELSLIDALPLLPTAQLEDWLPMVAESLTLVQDQAQAQLCRQRFWEVLTSGEMDIDRAANSLTWWTTRGGRDSVVGESIPEQESAMMSGALVENSKL